MARKRLRELRKRLGLSGELMAESAGFTKQAYSLLESGRMAARPERMAPINSFLRIKRMQRVKELRDEIALLESFSIDETLYL